MIRPGPLLAAGLGLDRRDVRLVESDPRWTEVYAQLAVELQPLISIEAIAIDHVGSTSVPGLIAKPILDVAIGLRPGDDGVTIVPTLEAVGFEFRGDQGDQGGLLFVLNAKSDYRVAHLHVVEHGDRRWARYLAFRDRLRADPVARDRYSRLKRLLCEQFPKDRPSYTRAKASFVDEILGST